MLLNACGQCGNSRQKHVAPVDFETSLYIKDQQIEATLLTTQLASTCELTWIHCQGYSSRAREDRQGWVHDDGGCHIYGCCTVAPLEG